MLADEKSEIRELAARRIKKARVQPHKSGIIRKYTIPEVDMNADHYYDLLNWQDFPITEPPMLMSKSDEEIERAIVSKEIWKLDKFPCHTQSVERHIKVVTEASAAVCGELRRDGFIRAKLLSRQSMPEFGSKKDWSTA